MFSHISFYPVNPFLFYKEIKPSHISYIHQIYAPYTHVPTYLLNSTENKTARRNIKESNPHRIWYGFQDRLHTAVYYLPGGK
jgi:hypothetical protein